MAHAQGRHNYNFVDLTGKTLAGCRVIRRAANVNGNARWLVEAACGCEVVLDGIRLRSQAKSGNPWHCPEHRTKRPGTVRRRDGGG